MTAPHSPDQWLHTKLMSPRLRSPIIARPALFARLDEGVTGKLTLVSAPTGFGKTTLVSRWLTERNIASAWVALDPNDNDPVRFWTYVVLALRAFDASIGKTALTALTASQPSSFQAILTPLLNELAGISWSGVLVLENYHVLTTAEIHETVAFLLQHLPEALHLVLVSRSEPDLPLGILRARAELVEIGVADLRFTPAETEAFLRETLRSEVPAGAVEKLHARTEGWAAGLRLAALALQDKGGPEAEQVIETFSGSHRYVADYLTQEVFAHQPETIQSFLLKICFLSRLTGSLCDAVTEASGGESALEQLERENLFLVQLGESGGRVWYRYHPLFAEALQSLARQRLGEAGLQALFEKASAWYAHHQMLDEAIEAALAAQRFEWALALVEQFVQIYSLSELRTLSRWMERIPLALTLRHPAICLMYAQVILFTSDRYAPATAARIEPYLQAAEATWQARGDDEKVGAVLAMRGMMLIWQGDFQKALEYVYRSLEKLPEHEVFWRGVSLLNATAGDLYGGRILSAQDKILEARALLGASQNIHGVLAATGMMSEIFYAQGDLDLCAQLNQQIMAEAVGEESMLDDQGNARLNLAHVAYEQNDLERAEGYAVEALGLGQQRANELLQAQAASRLAAIHTARGNMAQAQESLKSQAARLQNPLALRELQEARAQIAVRARSLDALGAWQAVVSTEKQDRLPVQQEREAFILARLRMAEGKPGEALALLQPLQAEAAEHGRVRSQVEALCLEALAHHAAGEGSKAGEALTRALAMGREKGFRRLFLDEGQAMAALLQAVIPALIKRPSSTSTKPPPEPAERVSLNLYAVTLLRAFPPEAGAQPEAAPSALLEPISAQELRVLRLLAAGLSNAEIARELVVSTNTVKTHVKNIYRKLNISSREAARQAARELKLL